MRRVVKEGAALGILEGALIVLGCDPADMVFREFRDLLAEANDPIRAAQEAARAAAKASDGQRVFAILDCLREWPKVELRSVLAMSIMAERVRKAT